MVNTIQRKDNFMLNSHYSYYLREYGISQRAFSFSQEQKAWNYISVLSSLLFPHFWCPSPRMWKCRIMTKQGSNKATTKETYRPLNQALKFYLWKIIWSFFFFHILWRPFIILTFGKSSQHRYLEIQKNPPQPCSFWEEKNRD